jgi:hypothetical protein
MLRPELLTCQQFASPKSPGTVSVNLLCRAHAGSVVRQKTGEELEEGTEQAEEGRVVRSNRAASWTKVIKRFSVVKQRTCGSRKLAVVPRVEMICSNFAKLERGRPHRVANSLRAAVPPGIFACGWTHLTITGTAVAVERRALA